MKCGRTARIAVKDSAALARPAVKARVAVARAEIAPRANAAAPDPRALAAQVDPVPDRTGLVADADHGLAVAARISAMSSVNRSNRCRN